MTDSNLQNPLLGIPVKTLQSADWEFQSGYRFPTVAELEKELEELEVYWATRLAIMHRLVDKTVKQWGSIPIRGFNQVKITSKLEPDCTEVLLHMANRLIKNSQKLEILPARLQPDVGSTIQESGGDDRLTQVHPQGHDSVATAGNLAIFPDKHGPDVGSTAFSSRPLGGGQSSPDTCGDGLHTQCHESATTAGSPEPASPALNNTPSASDQSVRASALLENGDDDEQPPPDRSLSDMERGVAPPAERLLNPSSVAKTCLFVSCEVCIAPLQIWYNAGTSLSPNAKILLLFVELFGVAGVLLCFGAYWFQRKHKTSGVMAVMGCVATICGLLSILGTRFPEKAMLWLTAALCGLPVAASPLALKELVNPFEFPFIYIRHCVTVM